jgi:hypothetical protein
MHHPKPDIDRLYVKRKDGGRCLLRFEAAYKQKYLMIFMCVSPCIFVVLIEIIPTNAQIPVLFSINSSFI